MAPTIAAEAAPYLVSIIGFLLIYVLYGIKAEIREVRLFVASLEGELRTHISTLDRRITVVETRCASEHGGDRCIT